MIDNFCNKLIDMIKEEYETPDKYRDIMSLTNDRVIKRKILKIIKEEINHFKILKKIKNRLCD